MRGPSLTRRVTKSRSCKNREAGRVPFVVSARAEFGKSLPARDLSIHVRLATARYSVHGRGQK